MIKINNYHLMYLDTNTLYDGLCLKNCLFMNLNGLKIGPDKKLNKFIKLIKNYDEISDKGYILEVDVKSPKKLHNLHSDLPFLPERMKINKYNKLVCNLYDKENYIIHTANLKQGLNYGLVFKKFHRVIQFNQESCLKPYINLNTDLREKANNDFEKDFSKLINNSVFEKTMENVRRHRDIRLVTTDKRRNKLVSEPNEGIIRAGYGSKGTIRVGYGSKKN